MSLVGHLRRTPVVLTLVVVGAAVGLAGCGDDTASIDITNRAAATTSTSVAETTTSSDTAADVTSSTVSGDESTTIPSTGGDAGQSGSSADADQDATDNSWAASPGEYRGQDGLRVAYDCPPNGAVSQLWGTGPFTDDSSVCTAAVYAGEITPEGGGRVVVEIAPGEDSYGGGDAHGATAIEYGVWAGSFTLVP